VRGFSFADFFDAKVGRQRSEKEQLAALGRCF
jgi:hypothetical protein